MKTILAIMGLSLLLLTAAFGLTTGNFGRYLSHDGGLSWEVSPNEMDAFGTAFPSLSMSPT